MAMAPVKFTKPPDLSGRTPIYRLSKNQPEPLSIPPQPTPSHVNNHANSNALVHANHAPYQPPPYHAPPYPPYNASQPPPPSQQQSTPQDNKENAFAQSPQHTPTGAQGSPMTKRRGRKLQENEILTLVNCCLEYQSLYHDNPQRFWYCVATSLKRTIKRNFSWQSCRQIVEELVSERRKRRREVAAGTAKEQPLTELVITTDKWISFIDSQASSIPSPAQPLKRPLQDAPPADPNAAKRSKPHEQTTPSLPAPPPIPPVSHPMPPYPTYSLPPAPPPPHGLPTIPSGPTMAEFQTLKVDIQSLRMDVQGMRREMIEVRNEFNEKFTKILETLQQIQGKNEPTDK
ncbi:uncharacterized protein BDV14DRAFT_170934, partial [Aspergillus stella-maris]|uniref:uncharacterized protein n=1 Tax=Aspergillus stella-maris TaxID=1810926 RepID=UPI003CCCA744